MNDLDLEDLESRLYSQVYHGFNEEPEQAFPPTNSGTTNLSKPTNDMRRSGARYFGPWSPAAKFQKQNNGKSPRRDPNKSDISYGKNCSKPWKSEIAINQVVVVSTKRSVSYGSSRQKNKARWREKIKERINQKRQMKMQNISRNVGQESSKGAKADSVITLSDSEDDSCVLVDNNWPVLSVVDSDDDAKGRSRESKQKTEDGDDKKAVINDSLSDDVIFVEPVVVPIEVINIDEENESHGKVGTETASSTSSDISMGSPSKKKVGEMHKERKELLSTPDSASNDFISTSGVELNQRNFNFSLHGSDFNTDDFVKPAPKHNETCETESSSSTTDPNVVNLVKTVVFNEIDFPKDDIFAENNLESFGNFITPLRNNVSVAGVQSSPVHTTETQNKNAYSSDSSSESDLDESLPDKKDVPQKIKQLPELSPMQSNLDQGNKDVTIPQAQKKAKKTHSMCSKYDLIESKSDTPTKEPKQKSNKKKKKKKKKSENNEESSSNGSTESSIPPTENEADDEIKRKKKRRSSFMDSSENQKKKVVPDVDVPHEAKTADVTTTVPTDSAAIEIKEDSQNKELESTSVSSVSDLISCAEIKKETVEDDNKGDKITLNEKHIETDTLKASTSQSPDLKEEPLDSDFTDLVVVDETYCQETSMVLSSDSESVLSPLLEHSDIQLNCKDVEKDQKKLATSDPLLEFSCNFSVTELQRNMSDDPRLWEILDIDRYPNERSRGRRCNKCKQFGHGAIRCLTKVESKCTLCGERGHYEPRCPNKVCTQCGHRSLYSTNYCTSCFKYRSYQCTFCSMKGHQSDSCPDLWRRYYLTTEEGPIVKPDGSPVKDKSKLWCSGCAQSGHLEHECHFFKSVYPSADPFIKSFDDVYNEPTRYETEDQEGLFYEPPVPSHHRANQMFQEYGQRHVGNNYNQNAYSHMNPHFVNPYVDGIFVTGQQNFFHHMDRNVVQYPQNIYQGDQNFGFNSVLPDFITLESEVRPPVDFTENSRINKAPVPRFVKQHNSMFFNSSALQLQLFIKEELQRLAKLSLLSNKTLKELKKRQPPRRCDLSQRAEYFEMLNMILFGIFNLIDGKMHLERLKRFKRDKLKSRLGQNTRRMLLKSYAYIFGNNKHNGVHYQELLRRI